MLTFLTVLQVVLALLLSFSILSQAKGSGGLSSAVTGIGNSFQPSKRGAEKVLYNSTVVFAVLFVLNSIAFFFVN